MTIINTVTGQIDSSELGNTLIHEHLRIFSESVFVQFPHLYDDEKDFRNAVNQVNSAKAKGVKTICDPTVMELGRDIRFMEKVSKETGVKIIAATGIYSFHYISPYFQNRSIDYMAELFVRDIEVGIQNTSIKAGFLKCATDRQGITPDVEKVIRAVARAHLKTGVPIMTHSHPASGTGIAQLDIFEDEGVNLNCVQIGHCGDTENLEYLLHILERGAFIGMDRYGLPFDSFSPSTERKNDIVVELIDKGYIDQMFLSQDHCCAFDWFPSEAFKAVSDSPITYLFEVVFPNLRKRGVTEEQLEIMMCKNVQQWFNC